jgi:hypothetical protein
VGRRLHGNLGYCSFPVFTRTAADTWEQSQPPSTPQQKLRYQVDALGRDDVRCPPNSALRTVTFMPSAGPPRWMLEAEQASANCRRLTNKVAAAIGGFHLVADDVREGHFRHLGRERRTHGRPITKARPEAVAAQSSRPIRRSSINIAICDSGRPVLTPQNTNAAGSGDAPRSACITSMIASAERSAVRGARPAFMRSPGTGTGHLAGAGSGKDQKLQRTGSDAFLLGEGCHEGRDLRTG